MKRQMLFLVYILIVLKLTAQEQELQFDKVGTYDIKYSECPFDKDAEAVVLFDKAISYFVQRDGSFHVVFERKTRIKILSDAGVDWANIEIPYYESNNINENVYGVEGVSYNYENQLLQKTIFDSEKCFNEKLNENWRVKKFAMPNVKAGTIIEYKYSIESEYVFNLRDWQFQWKIPVLHSEYLVRMIPFYQYSYLLQGATKFHKQTSEVDTGIEERFGNMKYNTMNYTFIMKDVKAFKDEEFITAADDYIIKLDFQLAKVIFPGGYKKDVLTTWPLLNKDMLSDENFGRYVSKSEKLAPKVFDLSAFANLNQKQKFDSVINYVKNTYTWNKKYRIYTSKSIKDLMTDKFGNSAEINLFTIGLLRGVGINAYPVLISTRDNGKIKVDYPFLDFFNNVIIKADVDSTIILSDATDLLIANNRIPVSCINDQGLIVQKDKVEWLSLQTQTLSRSRTSIVVNLNEKTSNAFISLNASEYDGLYLRKKYGTDRVAINKYFAENEYNVIDSTLAIKNMESYSNPYLLRFAVEFEPERIDNKIYLSPFLKEAIQKNPFKQQTRTYPIDMIYTSKRTFISTITIPEGFKIDFIPQNINIKNELFEMDYNASLLGDIVYFSLYYYFKKPVYEPKDYETIKMFYSEIINKANEKVVFVKE